ncbi:MAG TPA: iron uptake transporter permease EfeU [Marmoricola sp.]|jgi:high-affinity iron transporter|nr:iron uptake transporter permease EfeU [Marmoricola sp.]
MLPTFVIGLREGLEAALIVGIIAAFLRKQGRGDLLRQMALGVAGAVLFCTAGGVALEIFSKNLPQRQQEGLETVIGVLAVGMVTYMVIWMKEHSRGLKAELEAMAADAIDTGTTAGSGSTAGRAMVVMAGLAVLREGFETVVFLLAAFNESDSGPSAVIGAVLGIAVAIVLGFGIYRGGVRINLSKFFRATGLVLVLVAGGLVVSALHTAHEAGWLDSGQHRLLDLSGVVRPGSVLASLLTGMLGVQPFPVLTEVAGWLLYVIPVGIFVAWPPGRAVAVGSLRRTLAGVAVVGIGAGIALAATAPSAPTASVTRDGDVTARVVSMTASTLVLRTQEQQPLTGAVGAVADLRLRRSETATVAGTPTGVAAEIYTRSSTAPGTGPSPISTTQLAALNGGRLPLGVRPEGGKVAVTYADQVLLSVAVEPQTGTVIGLVWDAGRQVVAKGSSGQDVPLSKTTASASRALSPAAVRQAAAQVRRAESTTASKADRGAWARLLEILGGAAAIGLAASFGRRRQPASVPSPDPASKALVS